MYDLQTWIWENKDDIQMTIPHNAVIMKTEKLPAPSSLNKGTGLRLSGRKHRMTHMLLSRNHTEKILMENYRRGYDGI